MSSMYSLYLALASGPKVSFLMELEKPKMALSGVRSSWLMAAMHSLLAVLALSKTSRSAWALRRAVKWLRERRLKNAISAPEPPPKKNGTI